MRTPLSVLALAASVAIPAVGTACDSGSSAGPPDPPKVPMAVSPATFVELHDVGNATDASDFEVSFEAPGSLSAIQALRVGVYPVTGATPSVTTLAAAALDRAIERPTTAGEHRVRLPSTLLDLFGNPIDPGVAYRAAVLSVSSMPDERPMAVAYSNNQAQLRVGGLHITYLWNHGILVEDDTSKVVIDALQRRTDGFFIDPPSAEIARLEAGQGRYAGVRVAMASHWHEDHSLAGSAATFLGGGAARRFVGPPAATAPVGNAGQVVTPTPPRGASVEVVANGMRIGVYHVRHFDAFGQNFGDVDNYVYLLEMGGRKILHLGDADLTAVNLSPHGFAAMGIDVVVVPAWGGLVAGAGAVITHVAAGAVVASHLRAAQLDGDEAAAVLAYGSPIVFRTPLTRIYFP